MTAHTDRPNRLRIEVLKILEREPDHRLRWKFIFEKTKVLFVEKANNRDGGKIVVDSVQGSKRRGVYSESAFRNTLTRVLHDLRLDGLVEVDGEHKQVFYKIPKTKIKQVRMDLAKLRFDVKLTGLRDLAETEKELMELADYIVSEPPCKLLSIHDSHLLDDRVPADYLSFIPAIKTQYLLNKLKSDPSVPRVVLDLGEKILQGQATGFEFLKFYIYPVNKEVGRFWIDVDMNRRFRVHPEKSFLELMNEKDPQYAELIEEKFDNLFDYRKDGIRRDIYRAMIGLPGRPGHCAIVGNQLYGKKMGEI